MRQEDAGFQGTGARTAKRSLRRVLKLSLAAGLACGVMTAFLAPVFTATADLNLPTDAAAPVFSSTMLGAAAVETGFEKIGTSAAARLAALFGLSAEAVVPGEDSAGDAVREALTVSRARDVLAISIAAPEPRHAAALANALAEAVAGQGSARKTVAELEREEREADNAVAGYRAQNGYAPTFQDGEARLSALSQELADAERDRAVLDEAADALESGGAAEAIPQDAMTDGLSQALAEQGALQAEIADLSKTLLDEHPKMRAARARLAEIAAKLRAETRLAAEALDTRRDAAVVAAQSARNAVNEAVQLAERERQDAALGRLERLAAEKRAALDILAAEPNPSPSGITMLNRATVPTFPDLASPAKAAGAGFLGSAFLMGAASLFRRRPKAESPAASKQAMFDEPVIVSQPQPEPAHIDIAEIDVVAAAEMLISSGTERAIFVSPQGDAAAAATVLVAREIADAGLRVLLIDLTAAGAASGPMLDGAPLPGITDLLAGEARLSDVVHDDCYSQCYVLPVGMADPARAVLGIERLPAILDALTDAYDLVVAECGPADADGISRLIGPATRVFVTKIKSGDEPAIEARVLLAAGYADVVLVDPAGYKPPSPGRENRTLL